MPAFNFVRSTPVKSSAPQKQCFKYTDFMKRVDAKENDFLCRIFPRNLHWGAVRQCLSFQARDTRKKGSVLWNQVNRIIHPFHSHFMPTTSLIKNRHKNYNYLQQRWMRKVVKDINLKKNRENDMHLQSSFKLQFVLLRPSHQIHWDAMYMMCCNLFAFTRI